MEEKRIVEIDGVKLEVDLRQATQVEKYKIGDNVKVLIKEYSDKYVSYPGVIVGFDNFKERPTIVIAYIEQKYSEADIKFIFLNKDTEGTEICPMVGNYEVIEKATVVEQLNSKITQAEAEVAKLKEKRAYFLENFGKYFEAEK